MPWIERDVGLDEVEAVLELMDRLGGGEDPLEIAAGDDRPAAISPPPCGRGRWTMTTSSRCVWPGGRQHLS